MKRSLLYLILLSAVFQTFLIAEENDKRKIPYRLTKQETALLDSLQFYSFQYFIKEVNYDNGLVRDRSQAKSPASIAATGFALPIWAIGVEHKWLSREQASALTLNLLTFLYSSEQSAKDSATGYQGLFYHFIDINSGKRVWDCELSSIDTGLLLAGIRFAIQFYHQENEVENNIRSLGEKITRRINWNFFALPDSGIYKNTISLAWSPKEGLSNVGWVGYNEALIMYVLAAASGYEKIDKAYDHWLSFYNWQEPYPGLAHAIFPPLFGHHYSHLFIDFRGLADSYLREKNIDYFENARRAVLTQRNYAIENPLGWKGYDSLCWGLSACDGPGPSFNFDNKKFDFYNARGTSGKDFIQNDDGTIAPTAAISSIVFAPEFVLPAIKNLFDRYGDNGLWGKYGLKDAFNPTVNWFDPDYLGIDQGPIVIMIENFRTGFVWNYLMKDKLIQNGLKRLGFSDLNCTTK